MTLAELQFIERQIGKLDRDPDQAPRPAAAIICCAESTLKLSSVVLCRVSDTIKLSGRLHIDFVA
jgi:hypothetical protein